MPLDTGAVTQNLILSAGVDRGETADPLDSGFEGAASIGAAFRATRLRLGRSLQDVSDSTRIKRSYLEALEEMRLEDLPSRPFTIGYVKAYAQSLGLDPEAAVERFKDDVPQDAEPLRAPVGVRKHSDVRISLLAGGGALVITAVLVWNVAQHAMSDQAPPPPVVPDTSAPGAQATAPTTVSVSAAQPAPTESTLPTPYKTPGLGAEPAVAQDPAEIDPTAPRAFSPRGQVYGAATGEASQVAFVAKKSVSLLIRRPDGSVAFAQQLKPGEGYRAPMTPGLSVEVSETQNVLVYVAGQIHAPLAATVTALGKLTPPPAPAQPAAATVPTAAAKPAAPSAG